MYSINSDGHSMDLNFRFHGKANLSTAPFELSRSFRGQQYVRLYFLILHLAIVKVNLCNDQRM